MQIFRVENTSIKYITIVALILVMFSSCTKVNKEMSFSLWKEQIREKALKDGITDETFTLSFADVKLSNSYKKIDNKQYHRKQSFADYYQNHVNNLRIKKAKKLQIDLDNNLANTEEKFNVPKGYILALWGIETDFGSISGNYYVIEALANLAYNTRRKEFFEAELLTALKMINNNEVTIEQFRGSWAGANGQCQFMPSSYYKYAYDGNNDGKKNIWNNQDDIIASIANYLSTLNWDSKVPWGYEVTIKKDRNPSQKAIKLAKLTTQGLIRIDGIAFTDYELRQNVKILKLDNKTYITFNNFDILRDWNNSNYFAATVGILAEKI